MITMVDFVSGTKFVYNFKQPSKHESTGIYTEMDNILNPQMASFAIWFGK